MQVEVIEPHGMCAGVNGAIARALELAKSRPAGDRSPIYCLHELVHNEIVIGELKDLGFRFVDRIGEVPRGATVVFSAHGVPPQVREEAARRGLKVVDATCPFVARVHRSARAFAEKGMEVCVLGDPAHAEVRGIVGEVEDAGGRAFVGPHGVSAAKAKGGAAPLGVVAQTTMNSDEVERAVAEPARARTDGRRSYSRGSKAPHAAARSGIQGRSLPTGIPQKRRIHRTPAARPNRFAAEYKRLRQGAAGEGSGAGVMG